ncbi:slipin family protein [Streptomyces sp. NA04227]|uniref:slipin family protein n=1 Tax=Streptomyces sp. NA04227 TaxID=2742136 RepID=UPI001591C4DB|nr:slipin family protein [Streptomyces sp. NA04227]QKW05129.1 slipin family protein [Streptomyces sp. NA04227]
MLEELLAAGAGLVAAAGVYTAAAARVVKQYERGVVFRLGRLNGAPRMPGFTMVVPGIDRLRKVNMQIVTMPVPAQEGITRDNVTVRVDAVVYFKVVDAANAVVQVEDYRFAVSQMAQTSLRSIIGKSDLDDLLSDREKLNQGLELMIDSPAVGWGVQIDRVEIKDVSLPDTMKRSMARQAEADRERRARVINADAELQASKKLADAAGEMSRQPAALQLRLLQTVVAVAAEKNSTLVLPFPVELLRFLERAQQNPAPAPVDRPADRPAGATADGAATTVGTPGAAEAAETGETMETVGAVDDAVAESITAEPRPSAYDAGMAAAADALESAAGQSAAGRVPSRTPEDPPAEPRPEES